MSKHFYQLCFVLEDVNLSMEKLQLTGQNLGRVFNFRFGHLHAELMLSSKTA
jgi:hypothetical protein